MFGKRPTKGTVPPFRIAVDREVCIGSAVCVNVAPRVFGLDEAHKAKVLDPDGADDEAIRSAAEGCPVTAIFLVDPGTGKQVYP